MGNKLLYIIFLLHISLNLFSQEEDDFAGDGTTKMGFNFGANFNMIRLKQNKNSLFSDSINSISASNSAGYNVSMLFLFPISDRVNLKLAPGLLFIRNKINYSFLPDGNHKENLNYTVVPVPLQLNYYLSSAKKYYLMIGTAYSFMIGNTDRAIHKLELRPNDFELEAGIGIDIFNESIIVGPELKYSYSFMNHIKPENTIYNESIKSFGFHRITLSINIL
ncbi:MAG: hypothetical protein A2046_04100 [Bacteroidetes bacterium GWA2_30_7]|nr:MAG: hypothetical protein A2046_04100 [Bacteroidetes bacterium GWA2_30_7]